MATGHRTFADRARYATLDGLRFVGALLIVLFHTSGRVPGWLPFAAHAYLAVDFFLMLSGFVIALSYERKLQSGLSLVGFFKRRASRLYPLAVVGAVAGMAALWAYQSFRVGPPIPLPVVLSASLLNLAILPYFSTRYFGGNLFPANVPLWSLFDEICVNIAWATIIVSGFGKAWKYAVLPAAGLAFGLLAVQAGTANLGWGTQNFTGGVCRVVFCFLLGTLCFDVRHILRPQTRLANGPVLALVLSAVLVLAAEFPLAGVGWDLAIVFIVLPMILLGGVAAGTRAHAPLLEFLGDLSYPLYVVHFPIVQVVTRAREKLMPALPPGGGGIIAIVASLAAATILFYGFDLPVRRWLARRQIGGQP